MRAPIRLAALLGALALFSGLPGTAQAGPETLQRAMANIIQAPLDVMLAPVVAGRTLYTNLRDIDDTPAVRVVYAAPGYIWLTAVQGGAAILRGIAGCLELLPGIFLLPFETELDPLFDPADRGAALVEYDWHEEGWFPVVFWGRFGVTYTSAEY